MEAEKKNPPKILIVDDLSINVKILENIIQAEGYEALCALNVEAALDIMKDNMPQLILSDFSMPGMDGLEFCKLLKSNPRTRGIPFIFITVADTSEDKKAAFLAGAVDFIPKPFDRIEVVMRVKNQLNIYRIKQEMEDYNRMMHKMVAEQKKQMEKERERVLLALTKVMEKRDPHIGSHLEKVGYNCHLLAQSLQLVPQYENLITDEFIETIGTAAKLHDIGNIIMLDNILLQEEGDEKNPNQAVGIYAEEGAKILEEIAVENDNSRFLDMAILIARYHHANWDGSGYPENVKGKEIPLAARITAVVNDFDTLIWKRSAGEDNCVAESMKIINERSGSMYDPGIVDVFNKIQKQLRKDEE